MLMEVESPFQKLAEPYLHEICAACHATSAWLLQHDFNKRIATVIAEYESDTANVGEKRGEIIGEQYPEGLQSDVWAWLRSTKPHVMQFHTDALPQDSMEYFEYLEDDVKSVICFAVYSGAEIWGFVEVWDTRQQHDFSAEEIEAALGVIRRFEQLI